jgi:ATP-dependent protease HslVU (ClpYQ) peptidase subunit
MSLIIAVKDNSTIYMAADSQTTSGTLRKNGILSGRYKIKKFENGILLGAAGTLSSIVHLYLHDEWLDLAVDKPLTHEYILKKIVNPLYQELEKMKKLEKIYNDFKGTGCTFIIAKDNIMFQIGEDGSIVEIPNFVAIGSGNQFVYPYFKYETEGNIRTKLTSALKLASIYENTISPPFIFVDTERRTFEIDNVENHNQ